MAIFRASAQPIDVPETLGAAREIRRPTTVEGVAKAPHADPTYVWMAYAVVALGAVVAAVIVAVRNPTLPVAVAGVNVFASLYVAAQAIERTLEPLRDWLGDPLNRVESPSAAKASGEASDNTKGASRSDLRYVRSVAIKSAREKTAAAAAPGADETTMAAAQSAADVAAAAQAAVEEERANSAVIMWALASFLGVVIAACLGLGLLHTVGVQAAPKWLDVVVTGLAIGGGTKPLHDLIGNLQASKESKSDPADVKAT
jgi:hypothetical protein